MNSNNSIRRNSEPPSAQRPTHRTSSSPQRLARLQPQQALPHNRVSHTSSPLTQSSARRLVDLSSGASLSQKPYARPDLGSMIPGKALDEEEEMTPSEALANRIERVFEYDSTDLQLELDAIIHQLKEANDVSLSASFAEETTNFLRYRLLQGDAKSLDKYHLSLTEGANLLYGSLFASRKRNEICSEAYNNSLRSAQILDKKIQQRLPFLRVINDDHSFKTLSEIPGFMNALFISEQAHPNAMPVNLSPRERFKWHVLNLQQNVDDIASADFRTISNRSITSLGHMAHYVQSLSSSIAIIEKNAPHAFFAKEFFFDLEQELQPMLNCIRDAGEYAACQLLDSSFEKLIRPYSPENHRQCLQVVRDILEVRDKIFGFESCFYPEYLPDLMQRQAYFTDTFNRILSALRDSIYS